MSDKTILTKNSESFSIPSRGANSPGENPRNFHKKEEFFQPVTRIDFAYPFHGYFNSFQIQNRNDTDHLVLTEGKRLPSFSQLLIHDSASVRLKNSCCNSPWRWLANSARSRARWIDTGSASKRSISANRECESLEEKQCIRNQRLILNRGVTG